MFLSNGFLFVHHVTIPHPLPQHLDKPGNRKTGLRTAPDGPACMQIPEGGYT
jgi:hypothetical protein